MMRQGLGPGSVVAGYRITGLLGSGGMGSVYEAEHLTLRRSAALKTLLPELTGDRQFRERFVAESQMVAALDHPSIIPIYDAGEDGGTVYIAMRHVAGGDLGQLIARGPIEPSAAADILEQVAAALDAAHARGLVHRDVKPGNVLLDSGNRRVYLTDFGIAKQEGRQGLTEVGFFVGTLDYAAPEQIRGDEVGPSADIYAFGCLLFETLTGRKPFDRPTPVAVMNAQLNDPPPSACGLRPELPAAVDGVLARGLAKERSERFASCCDLIDALRGALGGRAAPVAAPAFPSLPPRPELIGRDGELAAVTGLLGDPATRLVTLTGPGGVGKTSLALAAAAALEPGFNRTVFVELRSLSRTDDLAAALAGALEGRVLCVLDGFEHMLAAAPWLGDLLGKASGLSLLVTSESRLRVAGERELPVPPLAVDDAARLFAARAPGFELTDDNREAVAAVCARLDGLPLAIELAAARVGLLSPQAILNRLEQRLELLTGVAGGPPALRSAIEWSYGLLSQDEAELLARLAVFAGGFSLEAANAVCLEGGSLGLLLDRLAALVDKNLVRQSSSADGEPRFDLLETVRLFGLERLAESGDLEAVQLRLAQRCAELVEAAEPELTRANQASWLERLDEEAANLRAAVAWAAGAGHPELALRIAAGLVRFWSTRGLMGEARALLARALDAGRDAPPDVRARAHFAAGYAALGEGDFADAKAAFERSLEAEQGSRAPALAQLAWLAMATGDPAARDLAEQSLEAARTDGDTVSESGALGTLAELAAAEGDSDRASELLTRGLELRRSLGDHRLVANSLLGLGRVELLRGDLDGAARLLEDALARARTLGDTWIAAASLAGLGGVELCRGEAAPARTHYEEALRLAQERNDRRLVAEATQGLAAVSSLDGDAGEAVRLAEASDSVRAATGAWRSPAETLIGERFLKS